MAGVPDAVFNGPWWALTLFLFGVVLLRAQATYWVGRLARLGGDKSRWSRRFNGRTLAKAQEYLDRWGPIGVPVSFLTIGFQTAVQAAAGFGKMRWPIYTIAMLPGCVAWAVVYGTLSLTLWQASIALARRSPWLLAVAVLAAAVVLTGTWWASRRYRTPRVEPLGEPGDD